MKKNQALRLLEHPDKDEIVAKFTIGNSTNDIHEWLSAKYSEPHEKQFVLSKALLTSFKDDYLDFYNYMQEDLFKITHAKALVTSDPVKDLELHVKGSSVYKSKLTELAGKKLDINSIVMNMVMAIEMRAMQVFDAIQEDPTVINTKFDRVLIEWFDTLGSALEKCHKIVNEAPDQIIQHNVTVQAIDTQVSVFYEAFKECLTHMDFETSMKCMDIFNQKMSALKMQKVVTTNLDTQFTDVQVLNNDIMKRLEQ